VSKKSYQSSFHIPTVLEKQLRHTPNLSQ